MRCGYSFIEVYVCIFHVVYAQEEIGRGVMSSALMLMVKEKIFQLTRQALYSMYNIPLLQQ